MGGTAGDSRKAAPWRSKATAIKTAALPRGPDRVPRLRLCGRGEGGGAREACYPSPRKTHGIDEIHELFIQSRPRNAEADRCFHTASAQSLLVYPWRNRLVGRR